MFKIVIGIAVASLSFFIQSAISDTAEGEEKLGRRASVGLHTFDEGNHPYKSQLSILGVAAFAVLAAEAFSLGEDSDDRRKIQYTTVFISALAAGGVTLLQKSLSKKKDVRVSFRLTKQQPVFALQTRF